MKYNKKIEIYIEFGSEYQKELNDDIFKAILTVIEQRIKEWHKNNKIDINIIDGVTDWKFLSNKKDYVWKIKLLWTDVEDWIRCEIWWYWKDWICYVTDCINKRLWE